MKKTTLSLSIAALLLTACGDNDSAKKAEASQAAEKAPATVEQSKEMSDKSAGKHQNNFLTAYDNIDLNQYKERVKTLSSDEFEGRAPDTDGGRKTSEYLKEQFKAVGAEPGNGDSYFQQVPLISIEADANMQLQLGEEKEDMARYIMDLNEELDITIIMIEHDMGVVMDISNRVLVLDFGKHIATGEPEEVMANPHVKQAYLGEELPTLEESA